MQNFRLAKLVNLIPEAIALSIVLTTPQRESIYIYPLAIIYSFLLRLIWQSAIVVHGLGHTVAIAIIDRELSFFNLTNILEHQTITNILKSLIPFNPIFCLGDLRFAPTVSTGTTAHIKFKASGGIIFNFLAAIVCCFYSDNFFPQAVIVANLLIAFTSLSDFEAIVTGVADCFYCGNFGFIARRKPEDSKDLLPHRMIEIAQQMGQETEIRGEQAGGGLVIGKNGDYSVFVGKKIVNQKRANLTKSLETSFASVRKKAVNSGIKPLDSITGVWHYRYATSGTAPSELETHWHEWISARKEKVYGFNGEEWICEAKNVHHRITHNGDFDSWRIFNCDVDNKTLGLWLERILHTPNATKGDSPKIAGMMDLLVTHRMWYASVRLAYQQAIATSIKDAFNGQKPTTDAPNTAPSKLDLAAWVETFERIFTIELRSLKHDSMAISPTSLKSSISLQQALNQALKSHAQSAGWTNLQRIGFIQFTLQAFFDNDLYRATQIFISKAKGSFGLVTTSTLQESELVLCAKGQPITVGFNWKEDYMVYASEPAAVDRILLNKPQSFRLDLDANNGEVAKVSYKNITVYSLLNQEELGVLHLQDRWISMSEHPHLAYIKPSSVAEDFIAEDIKSIPQVLNQIKTDWQNPTSLNRRSADYLVYLLTEKVQRFENKQNLMFKAGLISKIRTMPTVDILITGEENSLWIGQKFAEELRIVFPFLNIVTISANQVLQQLDGSFTKLNLDKDSLIFAITQSGQTYSTMEIIKVFDHLSSQGTIGELFILTGELSSFINSTQGKGGLTTISHSSFINNNDHRNRLFINGSGRRIAEASTISVAAAGQTLTELLLYLAQQMRRDFPDSEPLGMTLTSESLMVLAMMKEDFLDKNVSQIIGITPQGKPIKSHLNKALVQNGAYWAKHITETPLAWAIQALYIIISVGWVIPFSDTLPLVKTISELLFNLLNLPQNLINAIAPVITIADIGVYIFGAWLWTLAIRYIQGRQLLARTGKRTLVIGDVSWLNQLLQAYVSKLFALSYGIATIEVHSGDPQNHLLHNFGHRVVRGTLVWLGFPDGRRSQQHKLAENAVITTGKQVNGIKNLNTGAEIIALGSNSAIADRGFSKFITLDSNNYTVYFRSITIEQKEQIEQLKESCFGSMERLLASYVFFWTLAKKVAAFPCLKYEYWKSQSRTQIMTTASPIGGLDLSMLTNKKQLKAALLPTKK